MLIVTSSSKSGNKIKRLLRCRLIVTKRRAVRAIKALRAAEVLLIDRLAWSWLSTAVQKRLLKYNRVLVIC